MSILEEFLGSWTKGIPVVELGPSLGDKQLRSTGRLGICLGRSQFYARSR